MYVRQMYEQFSNKYGFNDGDSVPAGAKEYRDLLVKFVNYYFVDNDLELRAGDTGHNPVTVYWWNKKIGRYSDYGPDGMNELFDAIDGMEEGGDPFWEQIDVKVVIAPDTQEKLDELCDKMYTLLSE